MKVKISISLDAQTVETIDAIAKAVGGKRSTVIQKLLDSWRGWGDIMLEQMPLEQLQQIWKYGSGWKLLDEPKPLKGSAAETLGLKKRRGR